ncbi:MAG: deoxyhypusine synthase family protein [Bdellovibrionaceae bacterium]|nr:deoxyhypusine synthase family protein [Pseudobdellovibrionaceae bacterium]MDW8190037.1 deoxyhypusine synthase family protein [Pseudobdellovibrionaceae bacterium]
MNNHGPVSQFIDHHYRHFNAASLKDAARGYRDFIEKQNGKMLVTLAGAMSSAELGISLAEMIRQNKVHAISCTGANLEEDLYNLIAHNHYQRIPKWRELSIEDELNLYEKHLNRVTDTCIPEEEAIRKIESVIVQLWKNADESGKAYLPHEFFYQIIREGLLEKHYQINPKDSWLFAAVEKNLPLFVPGWEDSTTGNIYVAHCLRGNIKNPNTIKSGIHYMICLANWYQETSKNHDIGFFQIGGGIAGDFPICVVPMLHQDLELSNVKYWKYFCQISDSTTSYGSYSGAVPNEKITWCKLEAETPKFMIESDATIVAPLIFSYVLRQ